MLGGLTTAGGAGARAGAGPPSERRAARAGAAEARPGSPRAAPSGGAPREPREGLRGLRNARAGREAEVRAAGLRGRRLAEDVVEVRGATSRRGARRLGDLVERGVHVLREQPEAAAEVRGGEPSLARLGDLLEGGVEGLLRAIALEVLEDDAEDREEQREQGDERPGQAAHVLGRRIAEEGHRRARGDARAGDGVSDRALERLALEEGVDDLRAVDLGRLRATVRAELRVDERVGEAVLDHGAVRGSLRGAPGRRREDLVATEEGDGRAGDPIGEATREILVDLHRVDDGADRLAARLHGTDRDAVEELVAHPEIGLVLALEHLREGRVVVELRAEGGRPAAELRDDLAVLVDDDQDIGLPFVELPIQRSEALLESLARRGRERCPRGPRIRFLEHRPDVAVACHRIDGIEARPAVEAEEELDLEAIATQLLVEVARRQSVVRGLAEERRGHRGAGEGGNDEEPESREHRHLPCFRHDRPEWPRMVSKGRRWGQCVATAQVGRFPRVEPTQPPCDIPSGAGADRK